MNTSSAFINRPFMRKMINMIPLLPVVLILSSQCNAQTTGSNYFSGKPEFIDSPVGKVMVVNYLAKSTDNNDSIKKNSISGLVDLSTLVNKAINDPTGEARDFQVKDATKIGIIAYYHLDYTLFYSDINDALDLNSNKITTPEFARRIQSVPLPDYTPDKPLPVNEKKTFMQVLKMDHAYYSFPMRLSILFPFSVSGGLDQNFGFELSNVWSRPKSVVNFKFQLSLIWLIHKETGWYERFIIPSYNMGISFNFLGDTRFNLKPYITAGWNPAYYYFKCEDNSTASPNNLNSGWYLNTGALNYGIDLEAWIKKGLGMSISIEQSKYLGELIPDIYGSAKAVALDYLTFKIGLLF
jgi:hypothetical protein